MNRNFVDVITARLESPLVAAVGTNPNEKSDLLVISENDFNDFVTFSTNDALVHGLEVVVSDDAVIVQGIVRTGIAFRNRSDFFAKTAELIQGKITHPEVRPWSVGPWLPEAYCADIAGSQLIIGDSEQYDSTVKELKRYPEVLSKSIQNACIKEIELKTNILQNVNLAPLQISVLSSDVCMASIRRLFASERVYFRGLKYIEESAEMLSDKTKEHVMSLLHLNH